MNIIAELISWLPLFLLAEVTIRWLKARRDHDQVRDLLCRTLIENAIERTRRE